MNLLINCQFQCFQKWNLIKVFKIIILKSAVFSTLLTSEQRCYNVETTSCAYSGYDSWKLIPFLSALLWVHSESSPIRHMTSFWRWYNVVCLLGTALLRVDYILIIWYNTKPLHVKQYNVNIWVIVIFKYCQYYSKSLLLLE